MFIFDGGAVEHDAVPSGFRLCGVFGGVVGGVWYRAVAAVELLQDPARQERGGRDRFPGEGLHHGGAGVL